MNWLNRAINNKNGDVMMLPKLESFKKLDSPKKTAYMFYYNAVMRRATMEAQILKVSDVQWRNLLIDMKLLEC